MSATDGQPYQDANGQWVVGGTVQNNSQGGDAVTTGGATLPVNSPSTIAPAAAPTASGLPGSAGNPYPTSTPYVGIDQAVNGGQLTNTDYTHGKNYGDLGASAQGMYGGINSAWDTGQAANKLDTSSFGKYQGEAQRDAGTNSAWGNMQHQIIGTQRGLDLSNAAKQGTGALQQGQSQLAMQGGLRGGAGERMANMSGRGLLGNLQNIGAQANMSNLGVNSQDELNRQAMLQNSVGMANNIHSLGAQDLASRMAAMQHGADATQAAQEGQQKFNYGQDLASSAMMNSAGQFNIANSLGELGRRNAYNTAQDAIKAGQYGASNSAAAQQAYATKLNE